MRKRTRVRTPPAYVTGMGDASANSATSSASTPSFMPSTSTPCTRNSEQLWESCSKVSRPTCTRLQKRVMCEPQHLLYPLLWLQACARAQCVKAQPTMARHTGSRRLTNKFASLKIGIPLGKPSKKVLAVSPPLQSHGTVAVPRTPPQDDGSGVRDGQREKHSALSRQVQTLCAVKAGTNTHQLLVRQWPRRIQILMRTRMLGKRGGVSRLFMWKAVSHNALEHFLIYCLIGPGGLVKAPAVTHRSRV